MNDFESENLDKLIEFQDITGINDMSDCRDILVRHNWNLQNAVNYVFGEVAIPEQFVSNSNVSPASNIGYLTFLQRLFRLFLPITSAPPSSRSNLLYSVIALPFKFFYYAFMAFYQFLSSLIPYENSLPIRHQPELEISNFITAFEQEFGTMHPKFCQNSYGKTLKDAKSSGKFVLCYFHDFNSSNCKIFCEEILCNQKVIEYFLQNFYEWIFWACDIQSKEAHKILSDEYNENGYSRNPYSSTTYTLNPRSRFNINLSDPNVHPYLTISALKFPDPLIDGPFANNEDLASFLNSYFHSNELATYPEHTDPSQLKMVTVFRIKGIETLKKANLSASQTCEATSSAPSSNTILDANLFLSKLKNISSTYGQGNALVIEERDRREKIQNLRKQQEEELKKSLEADKLKIMAKKQERIESNKKELVSNFLKAKNKCLSRALVDLKNKMAQHTFTEPPSIKINDSKELSVKIIVKLPDGKRLERTFPQTAPIQDLYNLVFCHMVQSLDVTQLDTDHDSTKYIHESNSSPSLNITSKSTSPKSAKNKHKVSHEPVNSFDNTLRYNHFKLVTHYPRKNLPCDLSIPDKSYLILRVKTLLTNENDEYGVIFGEEIAKQLSEHEKFLWLVSDDHNIESSAFANSPLNTSQANTNDSPLSFEDCDLNQTTVIYVQDH